MENGYKSLYNIFKLGIPKLTHSQYEILFFKISESIELPSNNLNCY